jgi:very-short-patch-repair endonuclease
MKSNSSTPPYRAPLKRGIKSNRDWREGSLFPYWEIPKNKLLRDRARTLRKGGNLPEVLFWNTFKDKKKLGYDIDRQVIIGNYIVDFFIPELGLIFEVDGSSHDSKAQYDSERDAYMQSFDLQVIRIKDIDVRQSIGELYEYVLEIIQKRKECLFPS